MQSEQGQTGAYFPFVYAIRSKVTRDYYLRRLKIFFNYVDLLPKGTIEERCNLFAAKSIEDPNWAFSLVIKFLQFQNARGKKTIASVYSLRPTADANVLMPIDWEKLDDILPSDFTITNSPDIIRKHDTWLGILSAKQDIGKLISQAEQIS
jgi:hypothetical protein